MVLRIEDFDKTVKIIESIAFDRTNEKETDVALWAVHF